MKKIGQTMKQRCGDYIQTLQVVGYNHDNTHEVWELVREVYSPATINYASLCPEKYEQ